MEPFPPEVDQYLLGLAGEVMAPALIACNDAGIIHAVWGEPERYSLAPGDGVVGLCASELLPALEGLLPAPSANEPIVLPQIMLGDKLYADIHVFSLAPGDNLVLLVDVSETSLREQAIQQRANDLALLQASLARQNVLLGRAREDAEEASRAKTLFLASMSHELRTPLQAIIGYSGMLQEDAKQWGIDSAAADLKTINAAGKHLLALINDLLDVAKAESGKIELHVEEFDLDGLIEDVLATVRPLAEKNANTIRYERAPGAPPLGMVATDVTRVRQILFNLLSNACKFTKGGTVTLRARRSDAATLAVPDSAGDWIAIEVADSGIGMTDAQMARLFQPFVQADSSTTRTFGGTGLGLSICRKLARLLGGEIGVASEPGKGSTFSVEIPARFTDPDVPQKTA